MTVPQLYYLGIKAIIQNEEGLLLVLKHQLGHWDFPGGRIERGEEPLTALCREVLEETGFTALKAITPRTMVLTSFHVGGDHETPRGLIFWYHTATLGDTQPVSLSTEHQEYAWVTPLQAQALTKAEPAVIPRAA